MSKEEIQAWAEANGWKPDGYGHLQLVLDNGKKYRLKLQASSLRYEVRVAMSDGNTWVRVASAYYSKLKIDAEGKLRGLSTR